MNIDTDPRFHPGLDSPAWLAAMGEADQVIERNMDYREFLNAKRIEHEAAGIAKARDIQLNQMLFDWQRDLVHWSLRVGRGNNWSDCGLGKTFMELEWARVIHEHTNRDVLMLAPLAVAKQTRSEGDKFGIEVNVAREAKDLKRGINVTNYERLDKFDPARFGALVCDESSILKSYDGETRKLVTAFAEKIPYRLESRAHKAGRTFCRMKEPLVAMVCPYADRPQFIPNILKVFRSQSYQNKRLVIYDNGCVPFAGDLEENELLIRRTYTDSIPLGAIRNHANYACGTADIIAHLDSDDWSHPARLIEQVALLLRLYSADCVGYNKLLFARNGEAWMYENRRENYAVGTSLCYWRKSWERVRFSAMLPTTPNSTGEDKDFISRLNCYGESAIMHEDHMMVARIHPGNAHHYDIEAMISRGSTEWKRVPEFDKNVKEF